MNLQHEEDVKRKLYRMLLAIFIALGLVFIALRFFATDIGLLFGLVSRISRDDEKEDMIAPPPPYFYNAPSVTNNKELNLSGFSEPGSKVFIYLNGPEAASTIADSNGNFMVEGLLLIEGRNTLSAKAEDGSKNQSERSSDTEITYDTKKPEITITEPKDGSTIRNLNERIPVKGKLNEKCEVRVNGMLAVTKPDNTFEILLGVKQGKVEIEVEAVDEAGNKASESIEATYVRSGF